MDQQRFHCELGEGCVAIFKRKSNLLRHEREVHGFEKRKTLFDKNICGYCGATFHNKSSLNRHFNLKHADGIARKFPCTFDGCNKTFAQKQTMTRHVRQVHLGNRLHKCIICQVAFKRKPALKRHLNNRHHIEKPKWS